jgi:5-methylthioadenosine/S-adenosylhomocysteine deaminase
MLPNERFAYRAYNDTPKVGRLPQGNNSFSNPYRPNFLAGCCDKGQNTTAPAYVLRP